MNIRAREIFRHAALCAVVLSLASCARSGTYFFESVRGYGWLSADYYRSVVDSRDVPRGLQDEVLLSFTGTAEAPGIFYVYNFHEGNKWRLAALKPQGGETEAVFAQDKEQTYRKKDFLRWLSPTPPARWCWRAGMSARQGSS